MVTIGEYIKVKEEPKDIKIDGLIQKYDDSSQYMIGHVIDGNENIMNMLRKYIGYGKIYITFNRVNKIPYIDGTYLVSDKNIIDIMTEEEFNNL